MAINMAPSIDVNVWYDEAEDKVKVSGYAVAILTGGFWTTLTDSTLFTATVDNLDVASLYEDEWYEDGWYEYHLQDGWLNFEPPVEVTDAIEKYLPKTEDEEFNG